MSAQMGVMRVPFGFGFATPARGAGTRQPQAGAATQENAKVKRKVEDLKLNELLFQALYGDLSQFCMGS